MDPINEIRRYGELQRKQFDKVMRQRCKVCKRPMSEGGVSPYDYVCKQCLEK